MIIVHDGNYHDIASRCMRTNLCGARPRLSTIGQLYCAAPYAERVELIPESKWASRYEAMRGKFAKDRMARHKPQFQNQGQHPLCWMFSLAQDIECVCAKIGMAYEQLAPESIAGCNGYKDTGWMLDSAIEWAMKYGMAPRSMINQYDLNTKNWNQNYKREALKRVPFEVYDLGTKDMQAEVMTALLNGDSVYIAYMWLMHAMDLQALEKRGNEYGFWTPNTWGAGQDMLLYGRKKIPDEAYVIRAVQNNAV